MDEHIDKKLEPIHKKLDALSDLVKSGFPEGDPTGHRRAHEQWLEERKERKTFWNGVWRKIAENAAWAAVAGMATAVWYYLTHGGAGK